MEKSGTWQDRVNPVPVMYYTITNIPWQYGVNPEPIMYYTITNIPCGPQVLVHP